MKRGTMHWALGGLALVLINGAASGADWPQFRGPTGDGISPEKNLPANWSANSGIAWSAPLSGRGNSSPAVTKNRVDLTSQDADDSLWVLSLDRKTGKMLRKTQVGSGTLA
ncbi:MAG: hypothetical protein N2C14_29695, partial [Planctomycetales bacterium]